MVNEKSENDPTQAAIALIREMRSYLTRNGESGIGECFHGQMDHVIRLAEHQALRRAEGEYHGA